MSKFTRGCAVLLVGLASACGSSDSTTSPATPPAVVTPAQPPAPTPTTFSLTGTVIDSTTANGISGATLTIADGPNVGKFTTTSGSGSYSFTGLQPSGFTVNATASGYSSSSKGVTLTSNQTLSFALTPRTFTVSGNVTDGTSHGILPGIRIAITAGASAGKSTVTDSGGNYSITGVAAGTITLSGSNGAYQTVDKSVTIGADTRVDFVMPRLGGGAPAPGPAPAPGGLGSGAFLTLQTNATTCSCWNSPITFKINGISAASISCSGSAKVAVAPGTYAPQACDSIGCLNLTTGTVGAGQEQPWTIFCSSSTNSVRSAQESAKQ